MQTSLLQRGMVTLVQSHTVTKQTADNKKSKKYNVFQQALTLAIILLISKIIESFIPIPIVIGLVLLFIALCTGIVVKLGQVETVGTALTNNIGFLFVPAGIFVINSLPILSQSPILIILLIITSTILLLVCTDFASQLLVTKSLFPSKEKMKKQVI